mmetsp:Transcript_22238/g.61713  ORF Transcript_22238/g.61713 Transcript_22238/m.61713 type:complete len:389 (-) Transcript_22238:105-1271(-)
MPASSPAHKRPPQAVATGVLESEAAKLLSQCRTLSDRTAHHLKRSAAEMDDIGKEVKWVSKSITDLLQHSKPTPGDTSAAEALEMLKKAERVIRGEGSGGDLRKFIPGKTVPTLMRMMLGEHTQPIAMHRETSLKMKDEYFQFRNHVATVLTIVPAALLFFVLRASIVKENAPSQYTLTPAIMCAVHALLVWMVYAYTALALRENVLKLNGSDIRPWWIHHHYWSIISTILLLSLPVDSQAVNAFLGRFLFWLCCQGLVFLLQNHYQRRRLYTRIALGKSNVMDVVGGESAGGSGQLYLLYPFLFGLQFLQMSLGMEILCANYQSVLDFSGYLEMEPHDADLRGSRGVFYCGGMFLVMGLCNFKHTVLTIIAKRRVARQRKSEQRKEA